MRETEREPLHDMLLSCQLIRFNSGSGQNGAYPIVLLPRGEAQKARIALQSIYDRYLRHMCGVKYATPSAMLLKELGLSPLQVFLVATDT